MCIRDSIICTQDFIDYTKRVSYLGKFTPYSMRMREIICPDLHRILLEKASGVFRRVFRTGIYGVAEAPRFESAAEIQKMYADHCDVCGPVSYTHLDVYKRQIFLSASSISF